VLPEAFAKDPRASPETACYPEVDGRITVVNK
jgi:hypothetical protein